MHTSHAFGHVLFWEASDVTPGTDFARYILKSPHTLLTPLKKCEVSEGCLKRNQARVLHLRRPQKYSAQKDDRYAMVCILFEMRMACMLHWLYVDRDYVCEVLKAITYAGT